MDPALSSLMQTVPFLLPPEENSRGKILPGELSWFCRGFMSRPAVSRTSSLHHSLECRSPGAQKRVRSTCPNTGNLSPFLMAS